jgi:hypothetical protein
VIFVAQFGLWFICLGNCCLQRISILTKDLRLHGPESPDWFCGPPSLFMTQFADSGRDCLSFLLLTAPSDPPPSWTACHPPLPPRPYLYAKATPLSQARRPAITWVPVWAPCHPRPPTLGPWPLLAQRSTSCSIVEDKTSQYQKTRNSSTSSTYMITWLLT